MNRRMILVVVLVAAVSVAATLGVVYWLGDGHDHATEATGEYYCPMHPDYRSDEPGQCPICGMNLVKMEPASRPAAEETVADVYYCPMHPDYRSDRPGNCPICSMRLVKMEPTPDAPPTEHDHAAAPAPAADAPHTIYISPQRQQLIGMRTAEVVRRALDREIRTTGRVSYDERRLSHVHTKVPGYIEHVYVDFVGRHVRRGEPLFTLFSPELVAAQEELLVALDGRAKLAGSPYPEVARSAGALVEAARQRLKYWDVTDEQIAELERTRQVRRELTVFSPVGGIVLERMAYHHGRFVNPEMDLYTIVDLSAVWVLADIYEADLAWIKTGQMAEVELPGEGRTLRGRITFLSPVLNPETRTLEVRVEFPNPGLRLRPEMFVNVRLHIPLGEHLVVPEDAVLVTSELSYVFVDKGDGYIEPRAVELGPAAGGFYAIRSGLAAGERVATGATFLLDSESRLKGALAGMGVPERPAAEHVHD
jgi:membrane fusion protein, copper/silver efflux system